MTINWPDQTASGQIKERVLNFGGMIVIW